MARTHAHTAAPRSDLAGALREQLLSGVERGQALSLDAARTWVKAVSALPGHERLRSRGAGTGRRVEAAAGYSLDLASDLLASQRSFVRSMADVLHSSPRATPA